VHDAQKPALLSFLLKTHNWRSVLIFCSTKEMVKKLGATYMRSGLAARPFHSDLEQSEREEIMRAFKSRQLSIIIGTDVLSRGIDVEGISAVINYDVPPDPEDYVHRVGRTARAETTGTAITFINDRDQRRFFSIENLIGANIPKLELPGSIGPGPDYRPEEHPKKSFPGRKPFSRGPRRR
jgi:superfamily II DNA/RNA helicase